MRFSPTNVVKSSLVRQLNLLTKLNPKIWSGKRGSNSRPQPWQGWGTELEFVIMVIAVSCVKLLSAHNSTQHTSRKHKV